MAGKESVVQEGQEVLVVLGSGRRGLVMEMLTMEEMGIYILS